MRHYLLTNQEKAGSGFTDLIVLLHTDFTAAAVTETINLIKLEAGDVLSDICMEIVTPYDHAQAGTTIDIGHTGDDDVFIDGANLESAADTITLQGSGTNGSDAHFATNSASQYLTAKLVSTTDNVAATTAGEVRIWANIKKAAPRRATQA